MAGKGTKARGGAHLGKWVVRRHGHGGRYIRSAAAEEKAVETIERRAARRDIQDQLQDMEGGE